MLKAGVFEVVISKPVIAGMAIETLIIALQTVSDSIGTELALLRGLVEEEMVMALQTVGMVVQVGHQTVV